MKFKVQNFGPIKKGFNSEDGFMNLDGVTIFIGGQGTGKSSVAKSLSTMLWIEKSLLRTDFTEKQLMSRGVFRSHFAYHGIEDYFSKHTTLDYTGKYYQFSYSAEKLVVNRRNLGAKIEQPKIMYVPSERNFLSSYPKPSTITGLQPSLVTFLDEFESAKRAITQPKQLPVNQGRFSYDKLNDVSWIERGDNKTRLTKASSGYQSLVPLFLVIDYLANYIEDPNLLLSVQQQRLIRNEFEKAFGDIILDRSTFNNIGLVSDNLNLSTEQLHPILKRLAKKTIDTIIPTHNINIVEEPEQNLFPDSQIQTIYSLLTYQNLKPLNQLIITTHSPYVLSAVTLAIACSTAYEKNNTIKKELDKIVPINAWLNSNKLAVYEIDETGIIDELQTCYNLPSDDNLLNNTLGLFNEMHGKILDLEREL